MNTKILKILCLAMITTLACNLRPAVDVDATTTQAVADLQMTNTAIAASFTATPTQAPTDTAEPTATPIPTDTPAPESTDTAEPTSPPDLGVILFDDFSNPDEAVWEAEEPVDPALERVTVVDGRVLLESRYYTEDFLGIAQITYRDFPQDFAVTVEIEFTTGSSEEGEAGILIRLTPDYSADYEFTITPGGQFSVYKYQGEFIALVNYTQSDAIRTEPGAVNQLTVLAEGQEMTFLINGVEVVSVSDDDVRGGWLGLIVYNFDEFGVGAYFDNLLVTNLAAYHADPPPVP
ncbi:MAG TPA: family 16 glycoside hydrolase [Anaerolineales bacterium]|nr:family 16 glycoside hydrolase [Anaerolineales bacterium]